jgi:hypothetical protein
LVLALAGIRRLVVQIEATEKDDLILLRGLHPVCRYRANLAQIRQSRPESGFGFRVNVSETFSVVPSSLGFSLPPKYAYHSYLTQCIHQLLLESQSPHKTVNLIFELVIVNKKLTIL